MALCCAAELQRLNTVGRDGFLLVEDNVRNDSSQTLQLFGTMLDRGHVYIFKTIHVIFFFNIGHMAACSIATPTCLAVCKQTHKLSASSCLFL